jgi:Protein of unknown function (DUF2778)
VIRSAPRLLCAGIAVLVGFAVGLRAMPSAAVSEPVQPPMNFDRAFDRAWAGYEPQIPNDRGWQLASFDTVSYFAATTEKADRQIASATSTSVRSSLAATSSQQSARAISFDERFAAVTGWSGPRQAEAVEERADIALAPSPVQGGHSADRRAVGRNGRGGMQLASLAPVSISKKQLSADAPEESSRPVDDDGHTAIYDISAHKVYLPNGRTLEAHSGFGKRLDDPRYVSEKDLGPTPPNVYDLTLREEPFHGVRAIRLVPVGGGKMFGRDGLLAHSYMLGPNGQSNGCVSFSDYSAFLDAYEGGEVSRLVVVDHLETTPGSNTVAARITETLKAIFGRS